MAWRVNYDQDKIFSAVDNALFGTVAFHDGGSVHAIPTAIWREDKYIYIHGSNGSRLLNFLRTGAQVCVSITHMDGLVLARSAMHHSINYTSVCIYGSFEAVSEASKNKHMERFLEHWMPGRWEHVRTPYPNELAAVTIMRILIQEAVLKSRQGSPMDLESDMQVPVWSGIVPAKLEWQQPQQEEVQNNADFPGLSLRTL